MTMMGVKIFQVRTQNEYISPPPSTHYCYIILNPCSATPVYTCIGFQAILKRHECLVMDEQKSDVDALLIKLYNFKDFQK